MGQPQWPVFGPKFLRACYHCPATSREHHRTFPLRYCLSDVTSSLARKLGNDNLWTNSLFLLHFVLIPSSLQAHLTPRYLASYVAAVIGGERTAALLARA